MFDPLHRRIAYKSLVWPSVMQGELMKLTYDLETSGFTRQDVPYATQNYPFITEYGDALSDLAGNYLNSAQIYMRRPEWLMHGFGATMLQRMKHMDKDLFDSMLRDPYWIGMAQMTWRFEFSRYMYSELAKFFGDPAVPISYEHHYGTKGSKSRTVSDVAFEVPLYDAKGNVVKDVRYHADIQKASYRFDQDPKSPYYQEKGHTYYQDLNDGTLWRWSDMGLGIRGFNLKPYDIPIHRLNNYRVGFSPANSTYMYGRSMLTSKQRKKGHVLDVRDLAYWTSLMGPQGPGGLKFGSVEDPITGKIRASEALGAYHDANKGQGNPLRFIKDGPFMTNDGSYFDESMAHGASYDALGTLALENKSIDVFEGRSWIYETLNNQTDRKKLYPFLQGYDFKDQKRSLPLFSLRVSGLNEYGEKPYLFVGPDDQYGKFGNLTFLLADGSFHKKTFKGKSFDQLNEDEWSDYLSSPEGRDRKNGVVRSVHFNKWQGAISIDDVLGKSALRRDYIGQTDDIIKDVAFIRAAAEKGMLENIMNALEKSARHRRFGAHFPHIPLSEDELPYQFSGEVHYQEDDGTLKKILEGGPHSVSTISRTNMASGQNIYDKLRGIDEALHQLVTIPLPVDLYFEENPDGSYQNEEGYDKESSKEERRIVENFVELCENIHKKFRKKNWPHLSVLESIKNPQTGEFYFKKGKFSVDNAAQAYQFRTLLGRRILQDYTKEAKDQTAYIKGYVDHESHVKKKRILFADPDSGEAQSRFGEGAAPHVVDEHGRELSMEYLKAQDKDIVLDNLRNKKWTIRFYRLRSERSILTLTQRFMNLGMQDKVPKTLQTLYTADLLNRVLGMPNEDKTTARVPTIESSRFELEQYKININPNKSKLLERSASSHGLAEKALGYDEGQRMISMYENWLKAQENKYKGLETKFLKERRFDAKTNLPYDDIPYLINRDPKKSFDKDPNFIVIDVPIWHARSPIIQYDPRLPQNLLIVPKVNKTNTAKINKKDPIKKKDVIIRIPETGQLYHPGPGSIHALPNPKDPSFSIIQDQAWSAYQRAGIDPEKQAFSILGLENMYPVAFSRSSAPLSQSFKVPTQQYLGTTAYEYANMDQPITTLIMPLEYCPQSLEPGKPVRLREVNAELFSNIDGETPNDTGQTYETTLRKVYGMNAQGGKEGITLQDLFDQAKSGDIPQSVIEGAGFTNADHMEKRLREWFTSKWKKDVMREKVLVITFDQVNKDYFESGLDQSKNNWSLFNMLSAPMASFKHNNEHPPPHLYRGYDMD